jgi:exopolysaccharide biosynthesis polyprenyl glycosylphosphotransferase
MFSAPLERLADVLPLVRLCEEVGVQAHIQAESIACHSLPDILDLRGVPLLSYAPAQHSPELLAVKRFLDVGLAIIGISVTAPIMVLCAVLIKATSPGPVLFRQVRSGLNGRAFRMLKFRTMGEHAEAARAEVAHLNEATGPVFKIANDPRITRIGRFLRRWSVDELPQLFNVLAGDMSVVGPRPPIPSEVALYDRWQRRRLSMRPGLTCLWQIRGRHRIGFDEWMQLDLFYIDHWSLRLDFRILFRTISTVLSGSGA